MRIELGRARDSGNKDYFSMPYKRSRLIYVKLRRGNLINHRGLTRSHLYQIFRMCQHATR